MSQTPVETTDPIVQQLRALVHDMPDLKDAARFYEIVLPLLRDAELGVTPIVLTEDEARRKLEMGLPLLHQADLELDAEAARDLLLQMVGALAAPGARPIRQALEEEKLDIHIILAQAAMGDRTSVITLSQSLQLEGDLVWTLAQNALKPALRAWRWQLAPLAEGILWRKGYCYICGAGATLGELQDSHQTKHLRCGQCGADWQFPHLQCIYCGNQDHRTLNYLYIEGRREQTHVEACDNCHGYLKVIAAFSPTPPELLAIQDLATLHQDYIARERGYTRVDIRRVIPATLRQGSQAGI